MRQVALLLALTLGLPAAAQLAAPAASPNSRFELDFGLVDIERIGHLTDELANFTRAESTGAWFLYQRGIQNQAPGPDGGWGTYAHPRQAGSYTMTVQTVKSNVTMTKFTVRLMGVGGGPK